MYLMQFLKYSSYLCSGYCYQSLSKLMKKFDTDNLKMLS